MPDRNRSTRRVAARWLLAVGAAAIAATAILGVPALPFRVNWTTSMPLGLYHVRPAEIRSGAMVLACPPERIVRVGRERGYLPRGSLPGDSVGAFRGAS